MSACPALYKAVADALGRPCSPASGEELELMVQSRLECCHVYFL